MEKLGADELRSLRAYQAAVKPIPIKQDQRMYRKLYARALVTGRIAYDERGDAYGVIAVTDKGRAVLAAKEYAP